MRQFRDAPLNERCQATITLKDGSTAQCGRRRQSGKDYCWQHSQEPKSVKEKVDELSQ